MSIQGSTSLGSFSLFDLFSIRMPNKGFQVATSARIELHTFAFQHSLLFVGWQHHANCRATALRIDHPMPRRVRFVSAVHHKTYRARGITLAKNVRDLSVSHHAPSRNA